MQQQESRSEERSQSAGGGESFNAESDNENGDMVKSDRDSF